MVNQKQHFVERLRSLGGQRCISLTITGDADQGVEIVHRSQEVEECIYTTTGRELIAQDKFKLHFAKPNDNQKIAKPVIAPMNA